MMAFCSKMYVPSESTTGTDTETNKATSRNNIVLIPYSILKSGKVFNDISALHHCRGCSAALTCQSQLLSKDEYNMKKEAEDIPNLDGSQNSNEQNLIKGKFIDDLKNDEKGWICEYCDIHNGVPADTVVPTEDDNVYVIKKNVAVQQKQEETKSDAPEKEFFPEDETNLIFAIDISGSMDSTYTVNNDGKSENKTTLQLICDAILKQLEPMKEKYPNRKVGFVLFESNVVLRGDCKNKEVRLTASLDNFDEIYQFAKLQGEVILKEKLHESLEYLKSALRSFRTAGSTALGPGLLSSLGLAIKGGPGSRIVLCTDGMANVGLGSLSGGGGGFHQPWLAPQYRTKVNNQGSRDQDANSFYQRVGEIAVEHGVSVSIITVKGNACKVDALGPLTDQTAGTITRVDPADLDFSDIAANVLIARDVNLKVVLHEALSFQNEDSSNLKNNNTIMMKKVGNVSESHEVYFEYKVKTTGELEKEHLSLDSLEWIPLQSQITYTDMSGNVYVRVICKKQELTKNLKEVTKEIKADVLAGYVEKQSAALVLNGKIEEAQKQNQGWGEMMEELADNDEMEEDVKVAMKEMKMQQQATQQLIQQSKDIQDKGGNQVQKDEINSTWFSKKQQKKAK